MNVLKLKVCKSSARRSRSSSTNDALSSAHQSPSESSPEVISVEVFSENVISRTHSKCRKRIQLVQKTLVSVQSSPSEDRRYPERRRPTVVQHTVISPNVSLRSVESSISDYTDSSNASSPMSDYERDEDYKPSLSVRRACGLPSGQSSATSELSHLSFSIRHLPPLQSSPKRPCPRFARWKCQEACFSCSRNWTDSISSRKPLSRDQNASCPWTGDEKLRRRGEEKKVEEMASMKEDGRCDGKCSGLAGDFVVISCCSRKLVFSFLYSTIFG